MAKRSIPCCWQQPGERGLLQQGPRVALAGPNPCLLGGTPYVSPRASPGLRPTVCPRTTRWELAAAAWDSRPWGCPEEVVVLQAPAMGKAAEAAQPSGRASLAPSPAFPASGGAARSHLSASSLSTAPCFPNRRLQLVTCLVEITGKIASVSGK